MEPSVNRPYSQDQRTYTNQGKDYSHKTCADPMHGFQYSLEYGPRRGIRNAQIDVLVHLVGFP